MKIKNTVTIILRLFVILSVGAMIYKETATSDRSVAKKSFKPKSERIDATYFHTTARCYSCNLMEKYIKEVLNKDFPKELQTGNLNFQSINVETSGNKHYIQDYKLHTKSFILSLKNGKDEVRWLNCDKIWSFVRDEATFKRYIRSEVKKYLGML